MSFVGKIEELHPSDLLHILTASSKSGKLSLTRHDAQGVLVLRSGKIIYAASSSSPRETLGHLLLTEKLINERDLLAAIELQHEAKEEKRLGTILLERGIVSRDDLRRILYQQLGKVITEFMDWNSGFFKFEPMDLVDHGEVQVDAKDFLLEEGLTAEEAVTEATLKIEALEDSDRAGGERAAASDAEADTGGDLASLKSVLSEIRSAEFRGELTVEILGYAKRVFKRAVLFFVRRGNFVGLNHFGLDIEGDETELRRIKIPLDLPSILADAAGLKETVHAPLEPSEWNLYLVSRLGGEAPRDAAAVPLIVNQEVLLVLYGDNAGTDEPIGPLNELELLVLQAGLAMEKTLLEKRVEQFNRLRDAGRPAKTA